MKRSILPLGSLADGPRQDHATCHGSQRTTGRLSAQGRGAIRMQQTQLYCEHTDERIGQARQQLRHWRIARAPRISSQRRQGATLAGVIAMRER